MITPAVTIVIDWTCMLVTYSIFAGRLWVRIRQNRKSMFPKWDTDIILGLIVAVATVALGANTWKNVQQLRADDSSSPAGEDSVMALKLLYAQSFIYYIIVWLIKAAFLSTFWHFSQKITRKCKIALYILTALVIATFILITLTMFLTCLPIQRAWSLGPDFCSPQQKIWNHSKTAAANIVTDLFLIGLFIAILRNLSFGTRERWGIIFFLTISAIPILAAILRVIIVALALRPTLDKPTPEDTSRFNGILYLASEIELTTAFIAACLPAFRGYFKEKKELRHYSQTSHEFHGSEHGGAKDRIGSSRREGDAEAWMDLDLEMVEAGSQDELWPPRERHGG
ncbi:hypothetical protein FN846DRAFT_553966 [Sphaerosporella brunnea]|uniref:Rhodopsin domain-containing protein n=1 Tax=Sphaerosporella brunnea TaxID=1250544 RepID=A0A5J5F2T7_9PEZI|nr:hypothetical protein FN846DRAFT_553966 [Sphaerosporella brunnea]